MWFAALAIAMIAPACWAGYEDLMMVQRLESKVAAGIQSGILDPILGPGRSSVFVNMSLELKRERESSERTGLGLAVRNKVKAVQCPADRKNSECPAKSSGTKPASDLFRDFGFGTSDDCSLLGNLWCRKHDDARCGSEVDGGPRDKRNARAARHASARHGEIPFESVLYRESSQEKGISEERYGIKPVFRGFEVVIVHDKRVLPARLDMVREAILSVYAQHPAELKKEKIRFVAVRFADL